MSFKVIRLSIIVCCLGLMLPGPAANADEQAQQDTDVLKSALDTDKVTTELAKESDERRKLGKISRVTFEQVLADPDNVELNFRYAKTQVADNNLLGASATLERILMINPDIHPVRLFYAVVLYRLDSLVEAERELETLSKLKLPDKIREEVNLYKKQIARRQRSIRFSIRQSNGIAFDKNRNAAPSSKRRLVFDVPVATTLSNTRQNDQAFINVSSFDVSYDPGFPAGHEAFANFTYFRQEQTTLDNLDLESYQYEVGARLKSPWVDLIPSFTASHVFLSGESFLRTQGGTARLERDITTKWNVYGSFKGEWQDHLPVEENLTAPQRSGPEYTYALGTNYVLRSNMRAGYEISYSNKNAKEEFNAHENMTMRFNYTLLLGKGQYILNTADFIFDSYDEPDVAVAGRIRRDKGFRYRVSYGAPLTTLLIGKILPKPFKDISLSLTYEYFRSLSTITNNSYHNNKFQALLAKKWDF